MSAVIKGYELVNEGKLSVVINGDGNSFDGLGAEANDSAVLAEYDKRGGLIRFKGRKLVTGCFYDFKAKKARAKPVIEFDGGPTSRPGTVIEKIDGPSKGDKPAGKKTSKKAKDVDEEEVDEEVEVEDSEEGEEDE